MLSADLKALAGRNVIMIGDEEESYKTQSGEVVSTQSVRGARKSKASSYTQTARHSLRHNLSTHRRDTTHRSQNLVERRGSKTSSVSVV